MNNTDLIIIPPWPLLTVTRRRLGEPHVEVVLVTRRGDILVRTSHSSLN